MKNTNTCKHNWQYVDALGYWEDDYYIFVLCVRHSFMFLREPLRRI